MNPEKKAAPIRARIFAGNFGSGQKLDILRGLKRGGKDWLPEVKGMQPMSKSAPLTPAKPAAP